MHIGNMPAVWLDFSQMIQSAPGREASVDIKFSWSAADYAQWFSLYGVWVFSVLEARHEQACQAQHQTSGRSMFRQCFKSADPSRAAWIDAHWGVRCAFTHSNGDVSLLSNSQAMARSAPGLLRGVTWAGSNLLLDRDYVNDVNDLLQEGLAHIHQR